MSNKYLPDVEKNLAGIYQAEQNFQTIEERVWYLKPSKDPSTGLPTTAAGAPTTGTWALDELWIDVDRAIWRCTVAGTPGTWVKIANPEAGSVTANFYVKSNGTSLTSGSIADVNNSNHQGVYVGGIAVTEGFVYASAYLTLTADDYTLYPGFSRYVIQSNNATASNRTLHLGDGGNGLNTKNDGFQLLLEWAGANAGELLASDSNLEISADWRPSSGHKLALEWDVTKQKWCELWRYPVANFSHETVTYASSLAIDFNGKPFQSITLTGNLSISTTNRGDGTAVKQVAVRLIAGASNRTLTFDSNIKFVGYKPANIIANKIGILSLTSYGSTEADTVASYAEEP